MLLPLSMRTAGALLVAVSAALSIGAVVSALTAAGSRAREVRLENGLTLWQVFAHNCLALGFIAAGLVAGRAFTYLAVGMNLASWGFAVTRAVECGTTGTVFARTVPHAAPKIAALASMAFLVLLLARVPGAGSTPMSRLRCALRHRTLTASILCAQAALLFAAAAIEVSYSQYR